MGLNRRRGGGACLEDGAASRVDDPQGLVLGHGADGAAVTVPARAVDQVGVGFAQLVHQLAGANVPHTHHVVAAWRGWGGEKRETER